MKVHVWKNIDEFVDDQLYTTIRYVVDVKEGVGGGILVETYKKLNVLLPRGVVISILEDEEEEN